ncbi:DUF5689 domain-containing protein [uncultured Winogradskyella sp.]|uniref:DUF5689 domain-containing protein n=1 Tax=uncultured Winogradskyella sp. TaxID=395353 RepID=UPI0026338F64|nr:DUF5689 domain-containing protein [uncultured Winogradskyella sp.]
MKTLKINKLILLLIGLVVFNACVQDDEFSTPNTSVTEPDLDGDVIEITSIAGDVAQLHGGGIDYDNDEDFVLYDNDAQTEFVQGYVVSSDEGGNYFEEIIIQNNPENPTVGIKVLIDVNPLFVRYEVGRKVYVKLNGLYAGISNGVLTLGTLDGERIGKIPSAQENDVIFRSAEQAMIVPMPLGIEDFTNNRTNLMIELQDVQFNREQATGDNPLSYASEAFDEFDGERILESCAGPATSTFSTSTFADFKGLTLPSGRGSMTAVLTKDFFGEVFNVVVNSPEDINFEDVERCDPFDINDFDIVYEENFTDGLTGWEVVNTVGTRQWQANDFDGEFYARGSAFSGGTILQMVSWLISPSFDFDAQADESLVLEIADAFSNGDPLRVYYSNDYVSGNDPSTATWTEIGTDQILALPVNTGFFDNEYDQTDLIDLSGVTGDAVIAFVYDSNNATVSTTIDLSDVKILTPQ